MTRRLRVSLIGALAGSIAMAIAYGTPTHAGAASPCPMFLIRRTLVSPAPAATGVSRTVGSIVVSGPAQVAFLKTPDGLKLPLHPARQPQTFTVPRLAPMTTYTVWVQNTALPPACPEGAPLHIGSFTTR
jgi:hypothetical protein